MTKEYDQFELPVSGEVLVCAFYPKKAHFSDVVLVCSLDCH